VEPFYINVLQPLLLRYPKEVAILLNKWNKSKNPWERRASVVVFVRTIGETGKYTKQCIKLCNNLLEDQERLVLQGVGWALKDTMRGDKKRVLDYVKKLRQQAVSSVITLYALRDLRGKAKSDVLKVKAKRYA
jgi:3-methyladenine DNA glycosylase AlkD